MALDTAEKRQNLTGVGRPYMRSQFPIATPDEQWRVGIGNAYGGNALSPVVGGRIMSSMAASGGLAGQGGIAGQGGGLAG